MQPQNIFPFIVIGFIALTFGSFVFKIIKNGGFKGAMFGAPILKTLGQVSGGSSSKIIGIYVNVHVLGGNNPDRTIGLEIVAKSIASYQMMPVTLSKTEARKLITLLEVAASGA